MAPRFAVLNNAALYGDDFINTGQRNPTNDVTKTMPRTPIIETGAKAASDDKLHSGQSIVAVTPNMEACRCAMNPFVKPQLLIRLLNRSPITSKKVKQHPKQKTKFERDIILVPFRLFVIDCHMSDIEEPPVAFAKRPYRINV